MSKPVVMDIFGDMACFTRPECKVERCTYPVPTPSAIRGILSAVYSKPVEFYWQVRKIEVMKPIRYMNLMRNEVKCKVTDKSVLVEDERTQRNTVMLRDVYYRITADMIKRESFKGTQEQLYQQAINRISHGKCFFQPCLGTRECVCYFSEPDYSMKPISDNLDIGLMLYDVFDLDKFEVEKKVNPMVTLFNAKMRNGVIEVPDFHSDLVIRAKAGV
ncbi:MAG: type I-C CRISPR-associated protein Cas5c [Clostridia bacterium]|nr:type I-C CRISPR-associated protein Cas5c [Clostridia bacterium]